MSTLLCDYKRDYKPCRLIVAAVCVWARSVANLVFLESPAGVGFSYADSPAGLMHNDTSTAEDAYAAVMDFFAGYPEYKNNDFYIAGESCGSILRSRSIFRQI